MNKTKDKRRYKKDLSRFFGESVIGAILLSCITAVILVTGLAVLVFPNKETWTHSAGFVLMIIISCLTICLTGIILFIRAKRVTKPLTEINDAIVKISDGDFGIRINRKSTNSGKYQYENELDELTVNLNKMVSELEGMDYMRKDFMSNVSHEIKTPVTAITGFTEILLDGNLSEAEEREYLTLINQESIRLSILSENMLKMSRLDYQEIVSAKDKVRVDEQIRKCIIVLSEKWQDKNIEFVLNLSEVTIFTDKNLLMQVWMNLIDNAIKYSKNNSLIEISLVKEIDEIKVKIKDYGIGIAPDKLDKIYNRFYQCEESHKSQGSGLGLSIVKRIVDLLGGNIVCESVEGEGTTVTVRLKS